MGWGRIELFFRKQYPAQSGLRRGRRNREPWAKTALAGSAGQMGLLSELGSDGLSARTGTTKNSADRPSSAGVFHQCSVQPFARLVQTRYVVSHYCGRCKIVLDILRDTRGLVQPGELVSHLRRHNTQAQAHDCRSARDPAYSGICGRQESSMFARFSFVARGTLPKVTMESCTGTSKSLISVV